MDADTRQGVRLLTTTAAQRSDPAGLDAVNTFVTGQRKAVGGLLDGAGHAERDRTHRSLALLEAIRKRSDALRAAIACGLPAPVGSDTLGPAPTTSTRCPVGGGGASKAQPCSRARSPRYRSTAWIDTELSS